MPKILLCHHPEYYERYLKDKSIDLTVSGHAHGGQWRFFGKGVFAPGQGIFPRYTSGVYDGKLVVSRGLKPARIIPRFFNAPEVVIIDIE
jgi:predicted MPP superfamily phosphohydrolase